MKKKADFGIKLLVIILAVAGLVITASAQRKKTTTKRTSAKKVTTSTASPNPLEIRGGAEKVSIQIKNVSRFVYILGGIARGIEDIDKDARAGKVRREILDQNVEFKQNVIRSIQNLRAGLVALEIEFRTKTSLKNYTINLGGVSDLAARAEDQAANGQFTESGKTLLIVIERLSDTLVALP